MPHVKSPSVIFAFFHTSPISQQPLCLNLSALRGSYGELGVLLQGEIEEIVIGLEYTEQVRKLLYDILRLEGPVGK